MGGILYQGSAVEHSLIAVEHSLIKEELRPIDYSLHQAKLHRRATGHNEGQAHGISSTLQSVEVGDLGAVIARATLLGIEDKPIILHSFASEHLILCLRDTDHCPKLHLPVLTEGLYPTVGRDQEVETGEAIEEELLPALSVVVDLVDLVEPLGDPRGLRIHHPTCHFVDTPPLARGYVHQTRTQ